MKAVVKKGEKKGGACWRRERGWGGSGEGRN